MFKLHEVVMSTLGSSLNEALAIAFDVRLADASLRFFNLADVPAIRGVFPKASATFISVRTCRHCKRSILDHWPLRARLSRISSLATAVPRIRSAPGTGLTANSGGTRNSVRVLRWGHLYFS